MGSHQPSGRVVGFEPTIFWATTRRVNPYTTPAMMEINPFSERMLPQCVASGKREQTNLLNDPVSNDLSEVDQ